MIRNPAKALLRTQIKKTVSELSLEARDAQSKVILEKVSGSGKFIPNLFHLTIPFTSPFWVNC